MAAIVSIICVAFPAGAAEHWKSIFNGRNLDGWVPKINHHPLGENWRDTFQAKDGVLKVDYSQYPRFADEFGHLLYKRPLSAYRLRLEYRFMGPSPPGAQAWAVRNSGVMFHGQSPESMDLNQPYPIAVEAQLLGGDATETRPTGNVCTPGVTVSIGGVPQKAHCINSTSPTFRDGEWVRFELEVHGGRLVRQFVNGQLVMEYTGLMLDPSEFRRFANRDPGDAKVEPLTRGYISLQAESGPIEFRKIELMELKE
ncbi:DUF1080 domain-containing protein [Phenylobacterium sp.]|uniref:3-keto-disaccharide hydrolase n=1 Tax=Phenylobacterium sp. TaxID=1871053 RepID=UPI0025F87FFD|nr:DUF1080 domain-containing protein [Phenylobacterium sp.]